MYVLAVAAALSLAACGVSEDDLLKASSLDSVYSGGSGGSGGYGSTSSDPSTYGVIRGTVKFKGKHWKAGPLDRAGSAECIDRRPEPIMSEEFLIGPGDTLGGVLVYIRKGVSSWPSSPSGPAVIDQINCQYVPHHLVMRAGQELVVKSSDPFLHNVKAMAGPNKPFNQAMSTVGQFSVTFSKPEIGKHFSCSVHGWMEAFVTVLPHPLYAITATDGTFEIKGVPPGKYQLTFWHQPIANQKKIDDITVDVKVGKGATVVQDATMERN